MNDNNPRKSPVDGPDLGGLKTMPIPAARDKKRTAALAAAMAAFENVDASTQGKAEPPRLITRELEQPRSEPMIVQDIAPVARHPSSILMRRLLPLAATVCFAALVAPFLMETARHPGTPTKPAELQQRIAQPLATAGQPPAVPQTGPAPRPSAPEPEQKLVTQIEMLRREQATRLYAMPTPRSLEDSRTRLAADQLAPQQAEESRDRFTTRDANPIRQVATDPVSTFSIDVDTASYSFARRALNAGRLPQKAAVRVEEMINYFPYAYPAPESADAPLRPTVTVMPSPWNAANQIVHIGIKGYDIPRSTRPRANIVLLVDISGSMAPEDRLPLLKNGFRMLVETLDPEDVVSIVTYAAGSDIRLQPTKVKDKDKILAAIESLNARGSTHGAQGILDAYRVAEANFDKGGVNRIILGTDGDFNVGITDPTELRSFVERKRESGVFLSVLGVGRGNYNDTMMQSLAQNGNGVAAYIDTLNEARKVLVDQATSTLFPIATDVKIQVEFNPSQVSAYRLIGYEKRALMREDFNNDKVDAGDTGSGHTMTAIYEITRTGQAETADPLRYQPEMRRNPQAATGAGELAFLKMRYKLPKESESRLMEQPILAASAFPSIANAPVEARFGVAVAAFGQILSGSPYIGSFGYDDVIALANGARGEDPFGYRAALVQLARLAKTAAP